MTFDTRTSSYNTGGTTPDHSRILPLRINRCATPSQKRHHLPRPLFLFLFCLAVAAFTSSLPAETIQPTPAPSIALHPDGTAEILFRGSPGAPYQLERSLTLTPPWDLLPEQTSAIPELTWLDDTPPPPPSPAFYRVRATAPPFDATQFAAAADYSRIHGGAAVLVLQHGKIVFEDYHNGATSDTATHLHSATKAFWACALAAALEDGLITGYAERVSDTITEWQDTSVHPGKRLITVGHLASLSSGLSQDVAYIQGTDPLADDIYDYVVNDLRIISLPGNNFQYGPSHYYAFGVLLQRKLALAGTPINPLEYLEARVLEPLGIDYTHWQHDDAGNPHIPNGCTLTPRNTIRLGQFFLQQGWWDNREVIDEERMAETRVADGPNPGHGKFLWLNAQGGYPPAAQDPPPAGIPGGLIYHDGYTDILGALGAGKNRLYIIPSRNAVVLRQTTLDTDTFVDTDFLDTLLGD